MSLTLTNNTHGFIHPTDGYLPAGTFKVLIHNEFFGYITVNPQTITANFPSEPIASPTPVSFAGGRQMTISGAGFITNNIENNKITVCGLRAIPIAVT